MNEILSQLLTIQRLDIAIRTLGHDLQQIPKKSKLIDEKVREVREPYENAKAELERLKADADEASQTVDSLNEKEKDLKLKMPEIRSNEEYSALLKEMDAVKKAREDLDTKTIQDMERSDELEKELPNLEKAYLEGEKSVAKEREALALQQKDFEEKLLEKKKERHALQNEMSEEWLRKYSHIAAQRNGLAVVAVKGGTCQGCFISVRPKLIQDLHYAEEVVFCEGCQRILYLDEEEK